MNTCSRELTLRVHLPTYRKDLVLGGTELYLNFPETGYKY